MRCRSLPWLAPWVGLSLLCGPSSVEAQGEMERGDRVRVTVAGFLDPVGGRQPPNPVTGRLIEVTGRTLVVRYDRNRLGVPLAEVERVEVSRRLGSAEREAALAGFAVGAVVGYLSPSCGPDRTFGTACDEDTGTRIKTGLLVGGPAALLGFAIGRLFTKWGPWEVVPVESLRVGSSARGGVSVRFAVRP